MQDMSMQSSIAQVLQANKDHQQALKQYIEELEAKLGEVEPLLVR
jgi:phage shock protein A